MPKNPQPLPEYVSLIRWTVQDVINWLTQNELKNCVKLFRQTGVDGNKLLNITRADLKQIRCPAKETNEIINFVQQVRVPINRPGQSKPVFTTPVKAQARQPDYDDAGSGAEDDCDFWSDDEFEDDGCSSDDYASGEPPTPTQPVRGNRAPAPTPDNKPPVPSFPSRQPAPSPQTRSQPAPSPQTRSQPAPIPQRSRARPQTPPEEEEFYDEPDKLTERVEEPKLPARPVPPLPRQDSEDYEDPDKAVKVQHVHGGPLPTPPGITSQRNTLQYAAPMKKPSPIPPRKAPAPLPVPSSDSEEQVYEVADEEKDKAPPVPQSIPKRQKPAPPLPQPIDQDVYEVPEEVTKDDEDADDYLDMSTDVHVDSMPALPVRPKSEEFYLEMSGECDDTPTYPATSSQVPHGKQKAVPRHQKREPAPPLPTEKFEQDDYVEPVTVAQPEVPKRKHFGVPVLPGMAKLDIADVAPSKPVHQNRSLPPPPVAEPSVKKSKSRNGVGNYTHVSLNKTNEPAIQTNDSSIQNNVVEMTEADYVRQRWYHGNILRQDAMARLQEKNLDGMYLIRKSTQGGNKPYTLQIFYNGADFNLPIRRRTDNKFAVGSEKPNEKNFTNLLELVNFFKVNKLVLKGGIHAKLFKSLPQT